MDRRNLIKTIGALTIGAFAAPASAVNCQPLSKFGAIRPSVRPRGLRFYEEFGMMRGLARKLYKQNKNVFLWKNLEKEIGEIVPHYQGPAEDGSPGEGDCVGHSAAMGCDVLAATDIHLRGEAEKFIAKASVEMLYAGSRIEIGRDGRPKENPDKENSIAGRGGSRGEWAAKYLRDYGVLHRLEYEVGENKLDLTGYHPGRSRKYRDTGVPDWLESTAREHPVKVVTNPQSGMEALDAVCAGHPVIMCSSYAFKSTRDSQGFCEAYGAYKNRWGRWMRVQWWHAMILTGALLEGGRIGGLIQNSHSDWNDGSQPYGIPKGSFFVDLNTLDLMVKDWYDCWSLGSYTGHESKTLRNRIHKLWR